MVHFFVKSAIYFSTAFLILSFPVRDQALFNHLNHFAVPYTRKVFDFLDRYFEKTMSKGKKLGKQLFSNSVPQGNPAEFFQNLPNYSGGREEKPFVISELSETSPFAPEAEPEEDP